MNPSSPDTGEPLVLAIDQGTTGTTALVTTASGRVLRRSNREFPQHFPRPGWVEHDLEEIWESVEGAAAAALQAVEDGPRRVRAIGITNQRETVALWDAATGRPVGPAIVWQDRRTAARCERLLEEGRGQRVREVTGLVIDPYFSGTKLGWIFANDDELASRARAGKVRFSTIDGYVVHRLAGGGKKAPHVIEATNASRTLLMDLASRQFSDEMCELFGVPRAILPRIVPSAGSVARTHGLGFLPDGIPVSGIAGDQHAALFGQGCLQVGDAKCTYGTGAFVLVNTGDRPLRSEAGLLSTLAWQIGDEVVYALEGACFIAGAAVQWLRDGLGLIAAADEIEGLARSVESSEGVVFVPALSGLGAPHWDPEATGLITGITRGSNRAHLARATLEAIAHFVDDLLRVMDADLSAAGRAGLRRLRVDGGASKNDLLLELQAGLSGIEVDRPVDIESTARGAALLAALGSGLLSDTTEASQAVELDRTFGRPGAPECWTEGERTAARARWESAISRATSKPGSPAGRSRAE